ncbi:MAG: thioredoxin [Rhodobacteraceae bacterium]|nr:thioredoxin [Paracoccaceae bacterium]
MIDLNLSAAPAADDLIKDTTEATFMADVIEVSKITPVIVDFWAPWCGPCKTLGPQLESAVRAAKGAVKMVKVNVDEAQRIAGQLQIQSIPTVYAFFKGQPIDGFQGAVPQSEIKAFIDRVVKAGGGEAPGDTLADAVARPKRCWRKVPRRMRQSPGPSTHTCSS